MIASLGKRSLNVMRKPGDFVHPADYKYTGMNPVPHPKYTCNGCNAVGVHFRRDCPSNASNNDTENEAAGGGTSKLTRGLDRVPRPHGIPKSFLRKVSNPEEGGAGVMRDESGTFYVLDTARKESKSDRERERKRERRERERRERESGDEFELTIEKHMAALDATEEERKRAFYAQHPQKRHKKQSTCTHWMSGLCVKGELECDHLHSALPEHIPICNFFSQGLCSNGDLCMFRHVKPACPLYVQGFCPKGERCPLTHTERRAPLRSEWGATGSGPDDFLFLRRFLHR
jgi:hypothetical protein